MLNFCIIESSNNLSVKYFLAFNPFLEERLFIKNKLARLWISYNWSYRLLCCSSPTSIISILYFSASERTASEKLIFSYSIRNPTAFPPCPDPKSYHIFLSGATLNEGFVSDRKGLKPK